MLEALIEKYPDIEYKISREEEELEDFKEAKRRVEKDLEYGIGVLVYNTEEDIEVLLIENDWSSKWLMPGGGVEEGEGFEDAAVREVREETGVEITPDRPLRIEKQYICHGEKPPIENYSLIYSAEADSREIEQGSNIEGEEIKSAKWFNELPEQTRDRELIRRFLDSLED